MSTLKVDGIRSNSATSDAITLADNGTCTANITNKPNRNLIINGAMEVAQRGTSSTTSGYQTVDRFSNEHSGADEAPTYAQVDVASGTTPYTLGFRKAVKITNGDQSSAGVTDLAVVKQIIEAQNIAGSGWNYKSSSSKITLSFWVKSSVSQVFSGNLRTFDGTIYVYKFDTANLSANTWTKVTKTIPGNSNLTFNNDNGSGLVFHIYPFIGTDYTTSNSDTETWVTASAANYANDTTSTWWTTDNATFEVTGVQLEVSDHATDFEHRSYSDEFQRCQRYYQDWKDYTHAAHRGLDSSYDGHIIIDTLRINMRANPTVTATVYGWIANGNSWVDGSTSEAASLHNDPSGTFPGRYIKITGVWNWDTNYNNTVAVYFQTCKFDAEL